MIFADPNELSSSTLVHPSLTERAKPLAGLEERTGADFLIDPIDSGIVSSVEHMDLDRVCARSMLVQRKHGMDLVSSIADKRLFDAGKKMAQWTRRPWLAVIGSVYAMDDGNCQIGPTKTSWKFSAVAGALDWWQDPQRTNGGISFVQLEKDFAAWVSAWEKRLAERMDEDPDEEKIDYQTRQTEPFPEKWRWLATLETFPNIGRTKAIALGESFGHLADVLFWMSSPELYKADPDMYPKGIGMGTIMRFRRWLGLGRRNITWIDIKGDTDNG